MRKPASKEDNVQSDIEMSNRETSDFLEVQSNIVEFQVAYKYLLNGEVPTLCAAAPMADMPWVICSVWTKIRQSWKN